MQWRKRPVVVEAFQWSPELGLTGGVEYSPDQGYHIPTLEGPMRVSRHDWIITGVRGEQYPCKDGIFQETYEPVLASVAGEAA